MKTIKYISFMIITLLFANCESFIEEEPISVITSSSFWKTPADAQAGVIGAYDKLQQIYRSEFGGFIHWTDGRSDVVKQGQTDAGTTAQAVYSNSLAPTTIGTDWSNLYQAINMANLALKNIPNISMDPAAKEKLLGEAYFIRAYSYFMAARVWGDVPLITEAVDDSKVDLKPTRTARAAVLDQVRKDIESALSRVPASYGTPVSDRGRATTGVVSALKVDFLLWMARVENSGNADLLGAANTAASILANPMYTMLGNFGDIFKVKNNNETIWAIQYNLGSQETGNLGADTTPLAQGPYTGGKMYYQLSNKVINAYANAPATDLRAAATFVSFSGLGATNMCIKYIGSPTTGTQRTFDSNILIYRVGGIKLMYAEALNELGRTPEAITQLNDVRTRAGLPGTVAVTQVQVRQAILDENLVELPFEGSRWFTLIRSGRISQEVPNILTNVFDTNSKLLWPIGDASLRQNENLTQNKAYN
jgi:hypothetical protein